MKYDITINTTEKENNTEEITLSLNTANGGTFKIRSYGAEMDFDTFVEFADAINEIRQKFAVINTNKVAV